jgi:hypothetical protein
MKNYAVLPGIVLVLALSVLSCSENSKPAAEVEKPVTDTVSLIKHGEYLVTIMGCHDCHSPKRMGPNGHELIPELLLSGYPGDKPVTKTDLKAIPMGWAMLNEDLTSFVGPWGESFAANLTSDPTGIGNWTEDQFRRAFTRGMFKGIEGGRMLLPPMPWFNFTNIKDEDLKAIFLYLKSTRPVNNIVPAPIPPNEL